MAKQLVAAVKATALYNWLLDRAVHVLDLTIGPRVAQFGQTICKVVDLGAKFEPHWTANWTEVFELVTLRWVGSEFVSC